MRKRNARRPASKFDPEVPGIVEKVRFWAEQDRINQVLISKVIHQNELLTSHIKEHDNLPDLFSRQYQAALDLQSRELESKLTRHYESKLKQSVGRLAGRAKLPTWLAVSAFVISLTALAVSLWM